MGVLPLFAKGRGSHSGNNSTVNLRLTDFMKGVIGLYEYKSMGAALRRAAAAFLAAAMVFVSTPKATALEPEDGTTARMLIPVGHTVGIKLFSRGVVVVKPPESGTPAKACGLRSGDVIVKCGDTAVTSIEQFRNLLQAHGGAGATLQVRREAEAVTLTVEPEENAEEEDLQAGHRLEHGFGKVKARDPGLDFFFAEAGADDHADAVGQAEIGLLQNIQKFRVFAGPDDDLRIGGHDEVKARFFPKGEKSFHRPGHVHPVKGHVQKGHSVLHGLFPFSE